MHSLGPSFRALVVGDTGALGAAFVGALQASAHCERVVGLSRSSQPGFDLRDPASIAHAVQAVAAHGPFSLVVDATGVLRTGPQTPEKNLPSVQAEALAQAFALNATGPLVLLQLLQAHLVPGRAVYAKLSARVGSIADNRAGGWYSYRASKAALNMLLHTAGIELQRRHPAWVLALLQPGTGASALSRDFVRLGQARSADDSAADLLRVLDALAPVAGAQFVDYRGARVPW